MTDHRADLARRLVAIAQYLRTEGMATSGDYALRAAAELRRPTAAEVEASWRLLNDILASHESDYSFDVVECKTVRLVIALLRRLSPTPTDAEAVKRDFDTIEVFLGEAENYELADDSTVDITGPFDAMERIRGLVRRLSPAEEGIDIPDAIDCLKCIIAEQDSGRSGREYVKSALAALGVTYMHGDGDIWPTFKEIVAAAVKAAPAEEGWRPIKNAPKNGTRILGWDGSSIETLDYQLPSIIAGHITYPEQWIQVSDSGRVTSFFPTHWRPLPVPP